MIENIETCNCEERGCGRKFENTELLLDHYKRRHIIFYQKYIKNNDQSQSQSITRNISNNTNSNKILDDLYAKIGIMEKEANNSNIILPNTDQDLLEQSYLNIYQDDSDLLENAASTVIVDNLEKIDKYENVSQINSISLTSSKSFTNIDKEKVSIITDEMIGLGINYIDYNDIDEINLAEKNLMCFRTKQNVNFNYLLYVTSLNISANFIKDISDISNLSTLRILNISSNRIDDISPLENLEHLEVLKGEKNEITSIGSLNRCKGLKILELADNKIKYESSTYKTIKNLDKLRELTIKNNPFLNEVFGFKHLFIQKYPKIGKLDKEEISDLDREFAVKFLNENSLLNKEIVRPYSSKIESTIKKINEKDEKDDLIIIISKERDKEGVNNVNNIENLNRKLANIKDKVISQIEYKPLVQGTQNKKSSHPLKMIKNGINKNIDTITPGLINKSGNPNFTNSSQMQMKREIEELRNENRQLAEKNKAYEVELNTQKTEMDNLINLNKEYEKVIQDLRLKSNSNSNSTEDGGNHKLKQEVEQWKREYCDLLDKSMSTNVSTSRLLRTEDKFRPQTAKPVTSQGIGVGEYSGPSMRYEKTLDDLSHFKNDSTHFQTRRRNCLDDSLNNSDKEECIKYNNEEGNRDQDEEDNEIDEMLRRSVTNLASLKTEIKVLSKASKKPSC